MVTLWDLVTGNSSAAEGSTFWEHMNNPKEVEFVEVIRDTYIYSELKVSTLLDNIVLDTSEDIKVYLEENNVGTKEEPTIHNEEIKVT